MNVAGVEIAEPAFAPRLGADIRHRVRQAIRLGAMAVMCAEQHRAEAIKIELAGIVVDHDALVARIEHLERQGQRQRRMRIVIAGNVAHDDAAMLLQGQIDGVDHQLHAGAQYLEIAAIDIEQIAAARRHVALIVGVIPVAEIENDCLRRGPRLRHHLGHAVAQALRADAHVVILAGFPAPRQQAVVLIGNRIDGQ